MNSSDPLSRKTRISRRDTILGCLLLFGFAAIEWRLIVLQVLRHDELEAKAEHYHVATRMEQAWRGQIRDRNGLPLAVTVPVENVYADLSVWNERVDSIAPVVGPLLDRDVSGISLRVNRELAQRKLTRINRHLGAVRLKRGVQPADWQRIRAALDRETFGFPLNKLTGRQRTALKGLRRWTLFAEEDQRRYYPYHQTLAHVLGFVGTGTNGHLLQGKWGIEAYLDRLLRGVNGFRASSQDAAGNELPFRRTTNIMPKDGAHVVLTIDLELQKIVEEALSGVMAQYAPSNASSVVIRPLTGEILALACLPAFSPGRPGVGPPTNWRNHAISDRIEFGSVVKPVTLAAALDLGVVSLDSPIFCENGAWRVTHSVIHDAGHRFGTLSVRECLIKSSNIGFGKIASMIGPERLFDCMIRFGLDRAPNISLPQVARGSVHQSDKWPVDSAIYMGFGHGQSMSLLQLAMAYAAIGNHGQLMRPMLVSGLLHSDGSVWDRNIPVRVRQVIAQETAGQVREAMREVVEHGTGTKAALAHHSVSGKTGTAQKADDKGYLDGKVYCSFFGMVPANKTELVIAVGVDEPMERDPRTGTKVSLYGGTVAAPVFREIAARAVDLYEIPPDKGYQPERTKLLTQRTSIDRFREASEP